MSPAKRGTALLIATGTLTLALAASACSPSRGAPSRAAYRPAPCAFKAPPGVKVDCGYLTVPEDRQSPTSRTIHLHVALFRGESAHPAPDPVVMLEGGPGGSALDLDAYLFDRRVRPYLANRDVIVFDQRGTGHSIPALHCPEMEKSWWQGALACRDRLRREGVNLDAYSSAESAADVEDLRRALEYDRWNLFGESYGTRLALTVMRDFPKGLRSVILDSTLPPHIPSAIDDPEQVALAIEELFAACARDAGCSAAYPDLRGALTRAYERLEREPAHAPVAGGQARGQVVIDGAKLIELIYAGLYTTEFIEQMPAAIHALRDGTGHSLWGAIAGWQADIAPLVAIGQNISVTCADGALLDSVEAADAIDARYPWQKHRYSGGTLIRLCQQWRARQPDPRERRPVSSDIPTLILSGQFDPVTPTSYAREAARKLSHSHLLIFPGQSHFVSLNNPCAVRIVEQFLADPAAAPDTTCIQEMRPRFVLP